MREIVRQEADRGATVFFSSHVLGQVEAVCDRVGIMREGRLIAEDSVEGLREAAGGDATLRITTTGLTDAAVEAAQDVSGVTAVARDGDRLTVTCESDAKTRVLTALDEAGASVENFETESASLEDLFLAYTDADREVPA
jgi:ABC-2 type transport system ATP-binding protein